MVSLALFFSAFLIVMFGILGFVFGWFGREYFENSTHKNRLSDHPELFDDNGNPINSELYSVRFMFDEDEEEV
ncbi:DUF2973 domain-containing protein [bacterium]|nr:DUF2973 domain-containing protein [bacterium]